MTRDEAVEAVRRALNDEGSHPAYHREVMARHRKEWPTLWAALDALLRADGNPPYPYQSDTVLPSKTPPSSRPE